jgi:methylated-DNA-[protein]-cysteine S-methyltransferase
METLYFTRMSSPINELTIVADAEAIREIRFYAGRNALPVPEHWIEGNRVCDRTVTQLEEYFAGERRRFDLPLAPRGTSFQRRVWLELMEIPYGQTISYGEMARRIGQPTASRAVGAANGSNPIPIVIPCHRVIGKNGSLVGFGGGLSVKKRLLDLECAPVLC